jgi:hypothetical protein
MDKKNNLIHSISGDIIAFNNTIDFPSYTLSEFRSLIKQHIVNLSKKYDLNSMVNVPAGQDSDRMRYLDVVWFLDSIPVISFGIGTSFRIRTVRSLLKYNTNIKFYLHYGKISEENRQIYDFIDNLHQINLILDENFDRGKTKSNKKSQEITGPVLKEKKNKKLSPSVLASYELFKEGYSFAEIGSRRELKEETVIQHIVEAMRSGEYINLDRIIPREKQESIVNASVSLNTKKLTPIKEVLGERYSWDEIKLVITNNERFDLFE